MTDSFIFSAFSDEACADLEGQIRALERNGDAGCEVRAVDGVNVANLSQNDVFRVAKALHDASVSVFSVGSPAGKSPLRGDAQKDEEALLRLCEKAHVLGAQKLRVFSFFMPDGVSRKDCQSETLDRLGRYVTLAGREDITLCHENERGIFGQSANDCKTLADALPGLRLVFDPANFVLAGEDPWEAWLMLRDRVDYLHIKDAQSDGTVVPAGEGQGRIRDILADYSLRGGRHITLEPHLYVFDGLQNLEQKGSTIRVGSSLYKNGDEAFDAAHIALRNLIKEL